MQTNSELHISYNYIQVYNQPVVLLSIIICDKSEKRFDLMCSIFILNILNLLIIFSRK